MSPPLPPSPPSGPPNSMNFSRRKLMEPRPPSPLFRKILAWSRNFIDRHKTKKGSGRAAPLAFRASLRLGRPTAARAGRSARSALGPDPRDLQHRLMLTMSVFAPVILPPLLLEDDDLVGTAVLDKGRAH